MFNVTKKQRMREIFKELKLTERKRERERLWGLQRVDV